MSEEPAKQRIGFIDLAKGVCIILVVVRHCHVPVDRIPGLESMRMPLYFVLSGLFFKDYGGWVNFLVRKTNKLLVPFLFWYLLGCAFYYAASLVKPGILNGTPHGILDLFVSRSVLNFPIWFLLALFWCNVLFCTISLYVKKDALRILLVCLLGSLGVYLEQKEIFVPLFMSPALRSLPFFAFGYYLKHSGILYPNRCDRYNVLFAFLAWGGAYALSRCVIHDFRFIENILQGRGGGVVLYLRCSFRSRRVVPLQGGQEASLRFLRRAVFNRPALRARFDHALCRGITINGE